MSPHPEINQIIRFLINHFYNAGFVDSSVEPNQLVSVNRKRIQLTEMSTRYTE